MLTMWFHICDFQSLSLVYLTKNKFLLFRRSLAQEAGVLCTRIYAASFSHSPTLNLLELK